MERVVVGVPESPTLDGPPVIVPTVDLRSLMRERFRGMEAGP